MQMLKSILGVVVSILLALILLSLVELFSQAVYPFNGTTREEMATHVSLYPSWILALVVLVWGAIGFVCVWVATRISNKTVGGIIAVLLITALIFNLSMLPYVIWFKILMPPALVLGCWAGLRQGGR